MLEISSDFAAARAVERRVLREVAKQGYSEACIFAIKLALEEGLNNAICHGNRRDSQRKVKIAYEVTPEQTVITISDEGAGFNPSVVPDPTADENLEKPSGRGIMLMRAYMDEVQYSPAGNEVRMIKRNVR
jgi:serine/threonine-protein kinase RsbW